MKITALKINYSRLEYLKYKIIELFGFYDLLDLYSRLEYAKKGLVLFENDGKSCHQFQAFQVSRIKFLNLIKYSFYTFFIIYIPLSAYLINVYLATMIIPCYLISVVLFSKNLKYNRFNLKIFLQSKEYFKRLVNTNINDKKGLLILKEDFLTLKSSTDDHLNRVNQSNQPFIEDFDKKEVVIINIHSDYVKAVYNGLKHYFIVDDHHLLLELLNGGVISKQLVFYGQANKLVEVFRRLLLHKLINNDQEAITKFLAGNFCFTYKKKTRVMNENTIEATLKANQVLNAIGTIKIDGVEFILK